MRGRRLVAVARPVIVDNAGVTKRPEPYCRWMRADLERGCSTGIHNDRFDCLDALIYRASDGGYGIIIHDGGSSFVSIYTCPWCGADLHDGSMEAIVDGDPERDGVEFDLAPHLDQAPSELLEDAAVASWSGAPARRLLEFAARWNTSVADELLQLARRERDGTSDGTECFIDAIVADRWLLAHRPELAPSTRGNARTPDGFPGRRIDLGDIAEE